MDLKKYKEGREALSNGGAICEAIYKYCWKYHQYNPSGYQRGETVCPSCLNSCKPFSEENKILDKEYPSPSRWKSGSVWMTDEKFEAAKAQVIADAPTPIRKIGSAHSTKANG